MDEGGVGNGQIVWEQMNLLRQAWAAFTGPLLGGLMFILLVSSHDK
jgi:hypothetical protein